MSRLTFGVQPLPQEVTWAEWRDAWLLADRLGFDSLWSYDHVHAPRGAPDQDCFEGWIGLAALAPLTQRAEVGMLVSGVAYRNPALLVKMATTLDHVASGRSIFGLGAGWHSNEHEAYGWGFPSAGERVSRLAEALQIAHAMWAAPRQPATFSGTYYRVDGAFCNPPPLRQPRPPIMVAGGGPRITRLVARYADQWDCWPPLDDVATRYTRLRQECERIGRPYESILKSLSVDLLYEPDPSRLAERVEAQVNSQPNRDPSVVRNRLLAGSPAQMIDWLEPFVQAGVQQVILHLGSPYDLEGLARFAGEVMPAFR